MKFFAVFCRSLCSLSITQFRDPVKRPYSGNNRKRHAQTAERYRSKIAVVDCAREGDDVADIAHAGQVHDAALEAEAEAGVAGRAVLAQVKIEAVVLFLQAKLMHAVAQRLEVVLTLAAADDLADAGDEAVHGRDGLAVRVAVSYTHLTLPTILRV